MGLGAAKLTDLDDPLRVQSGPDPAEHARSPDQAAPAVGKPRQPRARPARRADARGSGVTETPLEQREAVEPPYAGSPKIAVNMRATKALWDRLGDLTRQLEGEGLKASRTELTEALWHFNMPKDAVEARELLRRYRLARLG